MSESCHQAVISPVVQCPGKVDITQRFTLSTDLCELFQEANILYWAKSLLDHTYTFVDAAIWLRFVGDGLAPVHSSVSKSATGVYLVEEKIQCDPNEFVKLIHKRDFSPSMENNEDAHDIADFLVFTQHVQYMKTRGLAFVSDHQGKSGSTALYTLYSLSDQDS